MRNKVTTLIVTIASVLFIQLIIKHLLHDKGGSPNRLTVNLPHQPIKNITDLNKLINKKHDPNNKTISRSITSETTSINKETRPATTEDDEEAEYKNYQNDLVSILQQSYEIYDSMEKYPPTSYPILKDNVKISPLEAKYTPETKELSNPNNRDLKLKVWAPSIFYQNANEVLINAQILVHNSSVPGSIDAKVFNDNNEQVGSFVNTYHNNYYELKLNNPDSSGFKNLTQKTENFLVRITATPENYQPQNTEDAFVSTTYSFALTHYYAKYLETITEKLNATNDLIFYALYDIAKKGTYIIEASIFNSSENLKASAERVITLEAGKQWIPIEFHGYIFFHNKLSGPFKLKNFALHAVNESNLSTIKGKLVTSNFLTKKYAWDDFNSTPYTNELLNEKKISLSSWRDSGSN